MTIAKRLLNVFKAKFFSVKFIFVLLTSSTIFWQCVSPPDFLGGDLLPPQDMLGVKTDTTFELSVYTVGYDTVISQGFSEAVVGETFDPVFGRTTSSFLTQLRLSRLNHNYGLNPSVDSAYLYLSLSRKLGNEPMNIRVFELTDSLFSDTTYNSLGDISRWNKPTALVAGTTTEPYRGEEKILKIRLNPNWVRTRLILPTSDTTIMQSQANFLKHLHGIYVAPITSLTDYGKGIYNFDYNNSLTRVEVYYKNDSHDIDTVSLRYTYTLENLNLRFNHFKHDYTEVDPEIGVRFNTSEEEQEERFFIKGLGSARGKIVLHDINEWAQKMPIVINRAELRIELEEDSSLPKDSVVNQLFLYTITNKNREVLLDNLIEGDNYAVNYIKSKKYYTVNITHHLQSLLKISENSNSVMYIEPRFYSANAGGAVLRSGNNSTGRMKLIITYTKL